MSEATSVQTQQTHSRCRSLNDFEMIKVSNLSQSKNIVDAQLGQGTYGNVKLVRDKTNMRLFALKIVIKKKPHLK